MDDEIKDMEGQTPEEEIQGQDSHSDYKPADRFDASAVHHLSGMYKNWFLDYASYVILERAVPHIEDGLKPSSRTTPTSKIRLPPSVKTSPTALLLKKCANRPSCKTAA